MNELTVIGGGLAGAEAAWQAAEAGLRVTLWEMRPRVPTGAHRTDRLAELVCSNSLGSALPDRASGILHSELRALGSILIRCADEARVPAGAALAVDRDLFAAAATSAIGSHPRIAIRRDEATDLPAGLAVVAAGPLASPALAEALARATGEESLFFYDAIAPVVRADTIDDAIAFRASRYNREEGGDDYLNCPFTREEYERFVAELTAARRIPLRDFEADIERGVRAAGPFFEGCLPVEILARRDPRSLAFGPMRPVGLTDPRTGRRPWAVVQLRRENRTGDLYNLVGFQTNLAQDEQARVFRMIPGLARAEFARYGQMHRNTYLNAPRLLRASLQWRGREDLFIAGQLAGVEGYAGNIATGWLAGFNAARLARGAPPVAPPPETMLGALCRALAEGNPEGFQPVKANLGLLPPLAGVPGGRRARAAACAARARAAMETWLAAMADTAPNLGARFSDPAAGQEDR